MAFVNDANKEFMSRNMEFLTRLEKLLTEFSGHEWSYNFDPSDTGMNVSMYVEVQPEDADIDPPDEVGR
mgnify:FL=1